MTTPERTGRGRAVASFVVRALILTLLWWAFAEGRVGRWSLSAPVILFATLSSLWVSPPGSWRWSPAGLARFLPFFLAESVRGGVDVARRALDPRLPVRPGLIVYPLRLPEGTARIFFANSVSLLPGTLSAELRDDSLRIHLLDRESPVRNRIQRLEEHVASLFAER